MRACLFSILFLAAYLQGSYAMAQNCSCISLTASAPENNNHISTIKVKISNGCNRRIWVYTKSFWITLAEEEKNVEKGKMYKLHNDAPEFILMKWQADEELTFTTDIPNVNTENIKLSYSNTTKRHVRNWFGYATYNCEKTIKPSK